MKNEAVAVLLVRQYSIHAESDYFLSISIIISAQES